MAMNTYPQITSVLNYSPTHRVGFAPTWFFQVVAPFRDNEVAGIMDDFGNFQEVLRGVALLRHPGGWWDDWAEGFSPRRAAQGKGLAL